MERERFLGRVRAALTHAPVPTAPEPYRPPRPPGPQEMAERLASELAGVGGVVHRVSSPHEARERVLEILQRAEAQTVIRGDTAPIRRLELDIDLAAAGIEVTACDLAAAARDALRVSAFAVDAGVTSVDFGIAETGTLALLTGPGQGRAVSLLPPLHIAVLDAADVVWELAALFEEVASRGALPSALTFITGPSRTGDIEQTLTIGVHGPRELHLVLIG